MGVDQWEVISGGTSKPPRREVFVGSGVLIQDNYKLIATHPGTAQWSGPLYPKVPATGPASLTCSPKQPCLFDIVADPAERDSLEAKFPEVVAKMTTRLNTLMKGVFEGHKPNVTKQAVCDAT